MKLDDFVCETICQIVGGLEKAQTRLGASASINPRGMTFRTDLSEGRRYNPQTCAFEEVVEFDIALTQEAGTGTAGGIGVFLGALSAGSKGQSENKESTVTRVRFKVPILFPTGPELG